MPQTTAQMIHVLKVAKPGDRINIVFANKTFGGDLNGRVAMLLRFFQQPGGQLRLPEMSYMNLMAVSRSGDWCDERTYIATVLEGYDAGDFIARTIGREMLESVTFA